MGKDDQGQRWQSAARSYRAALARLVGRVRQRGVNSVVASGLHFQAAFGVICSG